MDRCPFLHFCSGQDDSGERILFERDVRVSALQLIDDVHISAVLHDVFRLAAVCDFQIAAVVDRHIVCDAAVEDEQPACVAVVDRDTVGDAAGGDVEISAGIDDGIVRLTAEDDHLAAGFDRVAVRDAAEDLKGATGIDRGVVRRRSGMDSSLSFFFGVISAQDDPGERVLFERDVRGSLLQFLVDIHVSAVFHNVLRLTVRLDAQIAAVVDRSAVRDAAGGDEQPAAFPVVDDGVDRRAAAFDFQIAGGIDGGVERRAAGAHVHQVILQYDPFVAFAVVNIIVHKADSILKQW